MIVLDTNVVSEPMKARADRTVIKWLDAQNPETLYLTATSLAELMAGIDTLPEGKRKQGLASGLAKLLSVLFGPRILPFGEPAAIIFGSLNAKAKAAGYSISFADGQIAAIASQHGFAVATRDAVPFLAAGINVIDPWLE